MPNYSHRSDHDEMELLVRAAISRFPESSRWLLPSLLALRRYHTADDAYYRCCVDAALAQTGMTDTPLRRRLHELPYRFFAEQLHFKYARIEVLRRTPLAIRNRDQAAAVLRAARARGQGVILGCSHFGSTCYAVLALTGVVDELMMLSDDPTEDVLALCRKAGEAASTRIEPVKSDATAGLPLLRQLRRGGVVAAMLDSYYGTASDLAVPFMGQPAAASAGLYTIAARCSALVLPLALIRTGKGFEMELGEPIEASQGAQRTCSAVHAFFEACIRAHPDQWMSWPNLLARWQAVAAPADIQAPPALDAP